MTTPAIGYFICGSMRSGGGVLGDALWRTRAAGKPDQYFGDGTFDKLSERWGATDFPQYLDLLLEKTTTDNGVFGMRLTAAESFELTRSLKQCKAINGAPDFWSAADLIRGRFPATRYIWLRRRDKVRQAVSVWRAGQSGNYRRLISEKRQARTEAFSFDDIQRYRRRFLAEDRDWQAYFDSRRVSPLVLHYEDDIEADVVGTVRRVLDYVGVDVPGDVSITVRYAKQADDESNRLVRLFHEALRAQPE